MKNVISSLQNLIINACYVGLICALLLVSGHSRANLNVDLLPTSEAFSLEVLPVSENKLTAYWRIADDYYLYRDKISFEFIGQGIEFDMPKLPAGIIKDDPTFGTVATFENELAVDLTFTNPNQQPFTLIARSQGCNEPVGVCYEPQIIRLQFDKNAQPLEPLEDIFANASSSQSSLSTSTFDDFNPPNSAPTSASSDATNLDNQQLKNKLDNLYTQKDFLPVDEAFTITLDDDPIAPEFINFRFNITDGYYLYKDKIRLRQGEKDIKLNIGDGEMKVDPYFGEVEILRQSFTLAVARDTLNDDKLTLTYQGCAEDGICYAPQNIEYENTSAGWQLAGEDEKSLPILLLGALAAGLLLTFTPCVLPLVPILSAIIAGQKESLTAMRGGMLAIFYVLGTIATYAIMGALAGATGAQLQAYFQNVWLIGFLVVVFIISALAMFGAINIKPPAAWEGKLQYATRNLRGNAFAVFLLGLVSALIVGTCVSPILIAFLSIAISKGDALLGSAMMATMALGMGIPLIIYGFGAGKLIPKAGHWMRMINIIFGVMLLLVALYLLSTLPNFPMLLAWGFIFIIGGFYLWQYATEYQDKHTALYKGLSVIIITWGIIMLIGAATGGRDPLKPIQLNHVAGGDAQNNRAEFISIKNMASLEQQIANGQNNGKIVMLDFYADWCLDCVRMQKTTFTDNDVINLLARDFISVKIDLTDAFNEDTNAIKKRFNVFGPPAFIFIKDGRVLDHASFYGYKNDEQMLRHLNTVL